MNLQLLESSGRAVHVLVVTYLEQYFFKASISKLIPFSVCFFDKLLHYNDPKKTHVNVTKGFLGKEFTKFVIFWEKVATFI
jgi:hypothetical protein